MLAVRIAHLELTPRDGGQALTGRGVMHFLASPAAWISTLARVGGYPSAHRRDRRGRTDADASPTERADARKDDQ